MKGFEILTREVPLFYPCLSYIWGPVKVKYRQVTWAWNGDLKQDEMVTTDIKMGQIPTRTWPTLQNTKRLHLKFRLGMNVVQSPPNTEGLIYGYTCSRLHRAPRTTNALSCIYRTRKKGFFNWRWETLYYWTGTYNPETAITFKSVGKVPTFHLFLILFPHQHLTTCACHADHMMIL